MRALIIDDEPLAHKVILKYAEDIPFLEIVGQCYKATEAYAHLAKGGIELLFLDINMPRLKGLDFLRTLEHPPRVIVTSAYEEYALEGYELRVVDYLLKPFRFERFLRAVNTVQASLRAQPTHLAPAAAPKNNAPAPAKKARQLFVKVDKRQLQIATEDIYLLESYGNYVKIWIGEKYHLTPRTLTSFRAELSSPFAQVHKSFIVNRNWIDYVEGAMIVLRGGKTVPVGKNYRQQIRNWFV
ncbi:MAG: LytTR family DNA-binding domain-containing protein [Bacteroidota bacterium]